jgi:ligand-binding sensor domain-containing protein
MRNAITLHLAVLVALLGGCSSPPPARLRFEVVRSILEDSKGNFWFGSWKEGVCRFDGERLTYFTMEDGLSDNQIRSIREDRSGVVWFEGGVGISGFDGARFTVEP